MPEPVRPNSVLILADDLDFSDLGCYDPLIKPYRSGSSSTVLLASGATSTCRA